MIAARWPTDYLSLDEGRLHIHPDFLSVFEERKWRTLDAVMDADVDVVRRVGDRDNCRVDLGRSRAYLKRHWQRRSPIAKASPGRWEADAVGWCVEAGVPTMGLIASGGDEGGDPRRSFFLSEEIPGGVPADDFWRANPDRRTRERIIVALAETARKFHSAALYHRDFYWCHFFIRTTSTGTLTAHLIDLQRVMRRPWFGARWRVKDLGQFWFSAPTDATAADRQAWFDLYFDRKRQSAIEWAALVRAGFYRMKDGRA